MGLPVRVKLSGYHPVKETMGFTHELARGIDSVHAYVNMELSYANDTHL